VTDAAVWAVTQSGDRLKMFAAQQTHSFGREGRRLFESDTAASLAANYSENVIEAACDAAAETTLQLFTGAKPSRVWLNGRDAAINFNRARATVSLIVPAGRHQLKIVLQ
jgi:hypothetical protein